MIHDVRAECFASAKSLSSQQASSRYEQKILQADSQTITTPGYSPRHLHPLRPLSEALTGPLSSLCPPSSFPPLSSLPPATYISQLNPLAINLPLKLTTGTPSMLLRPDSTGVQTTSLPEHPATPTPPLFVAAADASFPGCEPPSSRCCRSHP